MGRPTKWGNPFIVGKDGTRAECVQLYHGLAAGFLCISKDLTHVDAQRAALKALAHARTELRGHDLACWCPTTVLCHADILLALANDLPVPDSGMRLTRI